MSDELNPANEIQTTMFLQNLVKLIPVEIVALWAIISGFIPVTASTISVWIIFGALTLLVPFYVIFAMKVKKISQIVLMTLAFPIWVFAIGGLPGISWFEPWMISVALALFTLVPPMFYGERVEVEKTTDSKSKITGLKIKQVKSWRQV